MIHGYHVVLSTYGFRLPNDLKGSMSRKVHSRRLASVGRATHYAEPEAVETVQYETWRRAALETLQYPPVVLSGQQAFEVAMAIGAFSRESKVAIWAFAILEEHLHLVLGRNRNKMEIVANLLKGAASSRLMEKGLHPMHALKHDDGTLPGMWSEGQWIGYLDSEDAIENAIRYVEENPIREGKKRQHWSFVEPFEGIPKGAWITYF